ncbi:1-acyl-sn-glycerol-3-phosphate acyltransferase [Candidatus Gastranaerophilus sp. (ex Termes propinquus)]|nr:1-acyl-sn-glycerol-3-phosphate acyltransferase [Candidatus Gastranaerophilus sp. (ex Termes propinquus)]
MTTKYSQRSPKEFNRARAIFQWFVTTIGYRLIYKIKCGYKVIGRENLPKEGFYIVASNHISAIDPFLMCNAIGRPVAFMAKEELFESFWSRTFMDFMGAFAVNREKLQVSTIKTALGIKKTNWVLGLFPQGRRGDIMCRFSPIKIICSSQFKIYSLMVQF